MVQYSCLRGMILFFCLVFYFGCGHESETLIEEEKIEYRYVKPEYGSIELRMATDSLNFYLDDTTYNNIKSFNTFSDKGIEYISFYDKNSQSVSIYELGSRERARRINLEDKFNDDRLFKTTAYCKNFDSIFITNMDALYLLDKKGELKQILKFLNKPRFAWAVFENTNPAVFHNNLLYAAVSPNAKETSLSSLKEWKVLYAIDLQNRKPALYYRLPELLRSNLYGRRFYEHSYCYNFENRFVFSFPGDSLIYETDLSGYHRSYYAKSRFQAEPIPPVSKDELLNDKGHKNYMLRDSYGPIYFDPQTKRYLRVAKSRISETDYENKKWKKKQRIIIFDEQFRIIGESFMDDTMSLDSIFFTEAGDIYVRVSEADETAIRFVKLIYAVPGEEQQQVPVK